MCATPLARGAGLDRASRLVLRRVPTHHNSTREEEVCCTHLPNRTPFVVLPDHVSLANGRNALVNALFIVSCGSAYRLSCAMCASRGSHVGPCRRVLFCSRTAPHLPFLIAFPNPSMHHKAPPALLLPAGSTSLLCLTGIRATQCESSLPHCTVGGPRSSEHPAAGLRTVALTPWAVITTAWI